MNADHRRPLPGTSLDYFDARAAVEAIQPGAYDALPYTSRVLAENLVRRCDPALLDACLLQLADGLGERDFPWYPARVVCHDILGQTALVDLAGLRDAIAARGGDPSRVNPVVPVQLVVDHSLAVECGGDDPGAFDKNRAIEDRRNEDRFHFIDWCRRAFRNVEVIDEDLGRSASGALERPGFERLVDDLCTGLVGAVLCLEASRLSRNGPDWHRLLELCGQVDARVIAFDKKTRKITVSIEALEIAEEKEAVAQYGSTDSGASLGDILGAALKKQGSKEE